MKPAECYTSIPKAVSFVSSGPIKFDEFVLDRDRYELHRGSDNVRLEKIPMELLILLVSKDGKLATREEIINHLWGKDVFVDTEHGINTAIRKIRQALKDDPDKPRFVQTVTGKGYRFIAECKNGNGVALTAPAAQQHISVSSVKEKQILPLPNNHSWKLEVVSALAFVAIVGVLFAFNIGGLRERLFPSNQIGPIHSIAVLPLTNLSGDPSQEYFADGMTDEMTTALAENHSLRVVSRTSAMQFKGANKPIREIAQSLGVDGILEGSVMRSNGHVHVNLQLIYTPTDTHVWAQSYDRDANGAMLLPEEVAQTIANAAKVTASPVHPHPYISPEAHEAYLQGRYFWYALNIPKSIEYFQKAIQLQPDYAAAWVGIGDAYLQTGERSGYTSLEVCAKEQEAVQKAMSLDDSVPEVHTSMAAYELFCKWDFSSANKDSLRSTEMNPNYAEGYFIRSQALLVMNQDAEALEQGKMANNLAPYERSWGLGYLYIHLGRIDDAINESRLRLQGNPHDANVLWNLANAYWIKGMYKDSEDAKEKALREQGSEKAAMNVRRAFERGGEQAVLKQDLEELLKRARGKGQTTSWQIAMQYARLGDKEHALQYLERAYHDKNTGVVFIQREPVFNFLHSDHRYRTIVKNMGLPPAY